MEYRWNIDGIQMEYKPNMDGKKTDRRQMEHNSSIRKMLTEHRRIIFRRNNFDRMQTQQHNGNTDRTYTNVANMCLLLIFWESTQKAVLLCPFCRQCWLLSLLNLGCSLKHEMCQIELFFAKACKKLCYYVHFADSTGFYHRSYHLLKRGTFGYFHYKLYFQCFQCRRNITGSYVLKKDTS